MNGLTLRLNKSSGKKHKSTLDFLPITIKYELKHSLDRCNEMLNDLMDVVSGDEQLLKLKNYLNDKDCDKDIVHFLVIFFLQAPSKHPVKCFIMRYVTKNPTVQKPFTVSLTLEIQQYVNRKCTDYKGYIPVVSKLATCIENFPAGAEAVKAADVDLAIYLKCCLQACITPLRESHPLSPTEKNELFNLVHLTLRLLLYIIQKVNIEKVEKIPLHDIKLFLKYLMFDEDVPMDTKSVCGILYLTVYLVENGDDSWLQILKPDKTNDITEIMENQSAKLSLYSAVATVINNDTLQSRIDASPAIVVLTDLIINIGERNSSESTFTLGVARTILQISKTLNKSIDKELGSQLVGRLVQFAWAHLDHHMDSVRHLTAQMFTGVVKYCDTLNAKGHPEALDQLYSALSSLDPSRKSYFVAATALAGGAAGATARLLRLQRGVIRALSVQAVQASATTTLETLLQKHVLESSPGVIYSSWVEPVMDYVASTTLEPGVLNILEGLLTKAVKFADNIMDYILPYIRQSCANLNKTHNIKCILMLLRVSRKSGAMNKLDVTMNDDEWKGIIHYDVLKQAAVDPAEETRILSLSLIVESPKSTEAFTQGEFNFILYYLKYNINAQSPNFRQLTLSLMKKFVKRLEDSYKMFKRHNVVQATDSKIDYYVSFLEELRRQCFDSLTQGANYSRRFVALQLLVWCELLNLDGYQRSWCEDYVEVLLLHLEDSYENNKALALDVLERCPKLLFTAKTYSISLKLKDIIEQASSIKPTECASAAYKMELLLKKLPENITNGEILNTMSSYAASGSLLRQLLSSLQAQQRACSRSVLSAAGGAPMYGLVHCMGHVLQGVQDVQAISEIEEWRGLIADIIETCMRVNESVACVVNNSSPEGHLPCDNSTVTVTDHGNSGGVTLPDGRQVTAQMVLLCAWRSVKEVSLLLGLVCSRLLCDAQQLRRCGEHFTALLAQTKHRGAFEQAYVGFTKLLHKLWSSRSPELHSLPADWLRELMATIASGSTTNNRLCATRRSAGLPFLIQALVTTELEVSGNPKCFHQCMQTLLRLARADNTEQVANDSVSTETRIHSVNILRALFRNSALEEAASSYVEEGLMVALLGFEGATWAERNSSTLLFSALIVRVFGVQRTRDRDSDALCVRNMMTGRIFFLRYPQLYDFMLSRLSAVAADSGSVLRPSLFPVLLLLARLYPSSLEGTVSNLKLSAFVPPVVRCGGSGVRAARRLAATAAVPLIAPHTYLSHIESMFKILCDDKIKRNYCHGILLQLTKLLNAKPEGLQEDDGILNKIRSHINTSQWILQADSTLPCFVILDEYLKVFNLIIWRFPQLLDIEVIINTEKYLELIIFSNQKPTITFNRELCLSNALYLLFIIKITLRHDIKDLVIKSLKHDIYEVVLSALNIVLISYETVEIDCLFKQHIKTLNLEVLSEFNNSTEYKRNLLGVLKLNTYSECTQKVLKVLTLMGDCERDIVIIKSELINVTDEMAVSKLIELVRSEHESLTHIYLQCLTNLVLKMTQNSLICMGLLKEVLWIMFTCSSSENNEDCRKVVVNFLENELHHLVKLDPSGLSEEHKFEFTSVLYATTVTLLEDENEVIRQRISNAISSVRSDQIRVIPSKSGEILRNLIHKLHNDNAALFVVLALLDFRCEVCTTDEINDECRVFDQNERYNTFLEENVWTISSAEIILQISKKNNVIPLDYVNCLLNNVVYRPTFAKLCNNNIDIFIQMVSGSGNYDTNILCNPKIKLFLDKLT